MTNWFKLFALKFLQVESVIIKIFALSSDSSPLTGVAMSIGSRSGVVVGNEEGGCGADLCWEIRAGDRGDTGRGVLKCAKRVR